ncbi:MAG: adenylosuccinate synthetase, partial [Thermoplasmata archaeon]|nr:adenylosuccinate synthetase [Thermoplasmata archaeon]
MSVTVIVGAQFGDEAKGKITDYLAVNARHVVRTGGGPNAGHSIHLPEARVVLHQLACGVLRKRVTGISGPGMVINPTQLQEEIVDLERRSLLKGEVVVSDRAHVVLPLHSIEDAWEEAVRSRVSSTASVGTTMRGIGPAYEDRYGRWGIRMADLSRPAVLKSRIDLLYEVKAHIPGLPEKGTLLTTLTEIGGVLSPYVRPTEPLLWDAAERGEKILLEGAQSALLDVDFGTYPYVTSSHPTSAGALVGSGLAPQYLDEVIGVAKAYCTRVGAGPFPTEASPEMGRYL